MRPFASVERFFERLFERPSARLFHARLQPIQLQRRVERAMENGRLSASDRVVVPNRYVVHLAPADMRAYGDFADSLELELADAALRFAHAHHYVVSDRPAVRLTADPKVDDGDARVDATFSDAPPDLAEPLPDLSRNRLQPPSPPDEPAPAVAVAAAAPIADSPTPAASRLPAPSQQPDQPDRPLVAPQPAPAYARPATMTASAGDGPPASRPFVPPPAPAVGPAGPGAAAALAAPAVIPAAPAIPAAAVAAIAASAAEAPQGIRAAAHPRDAAAASPAGPDVPASSAALPSDRPSASPSSASGSALAAQPSLAPPPPVPFRPRRQAGLDRLEPTHTMVFQIPAIDAPQVILREVAPDGSQRALTIDGGPVTIGRATDNNVVLRDSRVSRYHGRLAARQGALVYRDLGSTNGSKVNGVEIDEVVLGAGDRIELGDTVLVVESVAGA